MLSYHSSEDNRRKNQFTKDERLHLLNIMIQYAPLLDDKSASLFSRREIWRAIERDFHQAGFINKTSAQLKKYWQNYKYHGKRAQMGVRKYPNSTSKVEMQTQPYPEVFENCDNPERKIMKDLTVPCVPLCSKSPLQNVESGCHQRQIYGDNGTFFRKLSATPILSTDLKPLEKNRSNSEISHRERNILLLDKVHDESMLSDAIERKPEKPVGTDVIVSNTDISDNSVTVSVICPERTPKLLNKNQPKRIRRNDTPLERPSFPNGISVAPAVSPCKKRKDDDHSVFPAVAGTTKGRCFLLQPRQTDNCNEPIANDRRNVLETQQKSHQVKKESIVLPSKFIMENEAMRTESTRKKKISSITCGSTEDRPRENTLASLRDNQATSSCSKIGYEEAKVREIVTMHNQQRKDSSVNATVNDTTRANFSGVDAELRDRVVDVVQSELRDELDYRLMLHRLETEEKRLKVKIAEMAVQEIRFRIRALNEDIRRADELHELHMALATTRTQDAEGLHV